MTVREISKRLGAIAQELRVLKTETNIEKSHEVADALLTEALTLLGETQIVEAYNDLEKWYE